MLPYLRAFVMFVLMLLASVASAQQVSVAAAADLQPAMQEIAAKFHDKTGITVQPSYGSSGNFFTQLQNGAPFDAFFSANVDYARQLDAASLTEPGTLARYAVGKIVLWVPNESSLDLKQGLAAVTGAKVAKLAIANPQHAPYGQAAVAALKSAGLYDKVSSKLVLGENISQTMAFVAAGSADAGIVALSLALSPSIKGKGRYVELPADSYPAIEQGCVVMKSAKNKDGAKALLQFVLSPEGREILARYGFGIPASSKP